MGSLAGIYQNATRPNGYVSPLGQKMGVSVGSTPNTMPLPLPHPTFGHDGLSSGTGMPSGAGTGMALGAPGGMVPMQTRPQDYGMNMLPPSLPTAQRYPMQGNTLAGLYQSMRGRM